MLTLVGDITFVENTQNDYEELYVMYNIDHYDEDQKNIPFAIVHEIYESKDLTDDEINSVDDNGDSYLIPEIYMGAIVYENNRF